MKQRGITLIALIITIIILLILASITLGYVFSENGIITLSQKAAKNYIEAEEEESKVLENLYGSIKVGNDSMLHITMQELDTYVETKIRNATQTINYDLSKVLELKQGISIREGTIKRVGNVVCIQLTVVFATQPVADTITDIGVVKESTLIPNEIVIGVSHRGAIIGNSWIYNDGTIKIRGQQTSTVEVINLTYIL